MSRVRYYLSVLALLLSSPGSSVWAADKFSEGVRSSDPLTPEEQQKTFNLPPGFKIQLFAAERDIAKPMNMAFDARGRLWVTSSLEYPFAVPEEKKADARDKLTILEDTTGDGQADKVIQFAEGLNIPIGVYPFNSGKSALVWSIPNIWRMDDDNGDGIADRREALVGPLGDVLDTHGMQNGFTRGFDGRLYICHGFRNSSVIRGKDGSEIKLQSGNTYRLTLDGSKIEQYTWGQVNPFGMCFDSLGNLYTADCHSSPIYQLLRGGHYPSFGKPHDGLGFAPTLMQHNHGSTALCGVYYYEEDSNWPEKYRDSLLVGNVMSSRIHRDKVTYTGATPKATEVEDFLTCEDPWFRPVDIQMGPDGALYVADFYNRIIGHYEVPLNHKGRDRYRGRIWRITYEGGWKEAPEQTNLAGMDADGLIEAFGSPNLTTRMLAITTYAEKYSERPPGALRQILADAGRSTNKGVAALWALHRIGKLDDMSLRRACETPGLNLSVHALRAIAERKPPDSQMRELLEVALLNPMPLVARQAAETCGIHPHPSQLKPLLRELQSAPEKDKSLRHVLRMAIRNHLRDSEALAEFMEAESEDPQLEGAVAEICLGVGNHAASAYLTEYLLKADGLPVSKFSAYARHAAIHAGAATLPKLLALINSQRMSKDVQLKFALFQALERGFDQRGEKGFQREMASIAEDLIKNLMPADSERGDWRAVKTGPNPRDYPWVFQKRSLEGKEGEHLVISSLAPNGESLTGTLSSRAFKIPERLSFYLCGHDGLPGKPSKGVNYVRLLDASSGVQLKRARVPRHDRAELVEWNLADHAGAMGRLEIVDGDNGASYAWIGVSPFRPEVVKFPDLAPGDLLKKQLRVATLAGRYRIRSVEDQMLGWLGAAFSSPEVRIAALTALEQMNSDNLEARASAILRSPGSQEVRAAAAGWLARKGNPAALEELESALSSSASELQKRIAAQMVGSQPAAEWFLSAVEKGRASPLLLQDREIAERLIASKTRAASARIAKLTAALPSRDEKITAIILDRIKKYSGASSSRDRGKVIFEQQCSVCHQVGGKGNLIGPQLDGVGKRGVPRLMEDILDPNRNVDGAFRYSVIHLNDGTTKSGLFRRKEGKLLHFADAAGKEFSLAESIIKKRETSSSSLMPAVYGQVLTEAQFFDLISFLRSEKDR